MNLKITVVWITAMILISCGQATQQGSKQTNDADELFQSEVHGAFLMNLRELCGNSYYGRQVYRSHHGESWAERVMIMHVESCGEDHVHIPFHVDDDQSRTWMFFAEEGRLVFRHQHLNTDGTHEEGSMYGGYADDNGDSLVQYFPADEYTGSVIEDGIGNLWTVAIDPLTREFSYRLDRDGEKRFEIIFDLSSPVSASL